MVFLFALTMVATSIPAQTGFHKLPTGELVDRHGLPTSISLPVDARMPRIRFHAANHRLGNLDYAFNRDLKVSLLPGVSLQDVTTQNPYEIAPSPSNRYPTVECQ